MTLATGIDTERSAGRRGPAPRTATPFSQLPPHAVAEAGGSGCDGFHVETHHRWHAYLVVDLAGGSGSRSFSRDEFNHGRSPYREPTVSAALYGKRGGRSVPSRIDRHPIQSCIPQGTIGIVGKPGGNRMPCVLPGPPQVRTCCGERRPERAWVTDRLVGEGRDAFPESGRGRDSRRDGTSIQFRTAEMAAGKARRALQPGKRIASLAGRMRPRHLFYRRA